MNSCASARLAAANMSASPALGAAIRILSRTERCSSEVSCVTMPICARRLSCVVVRDILPVDQHPALLDIIKAQQQIDDGALAGAGTADQADFFARLDVQIEIFDHRARPPRARRR